MKTVGDLLSVALGAERETARRYARLAVAMQEHGNREAAGLFERLTEQEQEHAHRIEEWAKLEGIRLRSDSESLTWEDPQVPTDYDNEAVDPAHSSPYRALAFAVHNEERAFRFYTHVAAMTDNDALREHAETLACEELGHAALLRAMRRRAWHAEREIGRDEPTVEPGAVHCLADLLAVAASLEYCLENTASALSGHYPGLQPLNAALQRELTEIEAQRKTAGPPGAAVAVAIESIGDYVKKTNALHADANIALQRLGADSDRCFAFYDAVVAHTQNEDVMLTAQQLSASALKHIGMLQGALDT